MQLFLKEDHIKTKWAMRDVITIASLSKNGKTELSKSSLKHQVKAARRILMKYHSKRKIGTLREGLINILYGVGVRPEKMARWFKVSRATIYRHIDR